MREAVDIAATGGIVRSLLVLTKRRFYEYTEEGLLLDCELTIVHEKHIDMTDGTIVTANYESASSSISRRYTSPIRWQAVYG